MRHADVPLTRTKKPLEGSGSNSSNELLVLLAAPGAWEKKCSLSNRAVEATHSYERIRQLEATLSRGVLGIEAQQAVSVSLQYDIFPPLT